MRSDVRRDAVEGSSSRGAPPSLRVLMTIDSVGGVWSYALDLARALKGRGVDVSLLVLGPAPSDFRLDEAIAYAGCPIVASGLPLEWLARAPDEVERAGEALARLAAQSGVDILHLNSPALAASARFRMPVLSICHSCVGTWWNAVRKGELPPDLAWRAALTGAGLRNSSRVAAPTAAFARMLAHTYGLADVPETIWNGRASQNGPEGDAAMAGFVFCAGRLWDEGKNFAALERVASRLSLAVITAGPTHAPGGGNAFIPHATRHLGVLPPPEIQEHLSRRPIFISLAKYEPFGLAVLEAAQCGCPLILADIPTFRELWDGAAIFVAPDDDAAAACEATRIAADQEFARRLGHEAQRRSASYSDQGMADRTLDLYRSMLDDRKTAAAELGAAA